MVYWYWCFIRAFVVGMVDKMSNEKLTIGEQAEKQASAFLEAGLSKVETPKTGLGAQYCARCYEEIPMARRQAYNSNKCIDCMTREEAMARR